MVRSDRGVRRRGVPARRGAAAAGAVGLVLSACSGSPDAAPQPPRPATSLAAASPYEQAVLDDRVDTLWTLRDADGLQARDQVAALGSSPRPATVVGGTISGTTSPTGARGALFLRGGRLVTPVRSGLASGDAFTVELGMRADACTSAWGRVLGTTDLAQTGREGFEVLYFPEQFAKSPCRVGVEFWHQGTYLGGCHPREVPPIGRWTHFAVVYSAGQVSCFRDGALVEHEALKLPKSAASSTGPVVFAQPGPLGIGGTGSGWQGPLDGMSLAEVGLYRTALPAAKVAAHAKLLDPPATAAAPVKKVAKPTSPQRTKR